MVCESAGRIAGRDGTMEQDRYTYSDLLTVTVALLQEKEVPAEAAKLIAETLVEADLMGHSTHGLALLPAYLR